MKIFITLLTSLLLSVSILAADKGQILRDAGPNYSGVEGPYYHREAVSENLDTRVFKITANVVKEGRFVSDELKEVLKDAVQREQKEFCYYTLRNEWGNLKEAYAESLISLVDTKTECYSYKSRPCPYCKKVRRTYCEMTVVAKCQKNEETSILSNFEIKKMGCGRFLTCRESKGFL